MLLVVEDDPLALRAILRLVGDRAAQVATSAAEVRAAVPTSRAWSGLLVDAGLPEGPMAGIDIVREIRGTGPLIPSAIVTGRLERAVVQAGADLNAMVILKPDVHAGVAHFLARVDAVANGPDRAAAIADARERYGLTSREAEIVAWFIEGGDSASFLEHARIARTTFKTHRENILRKTAARSLEEVAIRLLGDLLGGRGA